MTPEAKARLVIDKKLAECGYVLQDMSEFNPAASLGVAVREYPTDSGPVDYLLFINKVSVGVVEAKATNKGELPLTLFELPEVLSRRKHGKPRVSKRLNGKSLEERPPEVDERSTFGHWESDTVLGQKKKGEPAVFTIVERLTGCYLAIRTEGKTTSGIAGAMEQLRAQFGDRFTEVFRTITTDNGSEFAAFSEFEALGTEVYFAHPYSAWERPVNERSNRILRRFVPKGVSIQNYTDEAILMFADEINALPRKRLHYRTPEELFDAQLALIYRCH